MILAGVGITGQDGDVTFEFFTDRLCLNFCGTLAGRGTLDEEQLRHGEDLQQWISEAGLFDGVPWVGQAGLRRALELREAIYSAVTALLNGRPVAAESRKLINSAAQVSPPTLRLTSGGVSRSGNLASALSLVARDCLELYDGSDHDAIRMCADPICTRLFIDRSRGHRRRWCGMKGCGDRAKAAAYRRRQNAGSG